MLKKGEWCRVSIVLLETWKENKSIIGFQFGKFFLTKIFKIRYAMNLSQCGMGDATVVFPLEIPSINGEP